MPGQTARLAAVLTAIGRNRTDPERKRLLRLTTLFEAIRRTHLGETHRAPRPSPPVDVVALADFLQKVGPAADRARLDGLMLNVWSIAGLGRDEVRTTKVLAWVLDCRGSHGLGSAVLDSLVDLLLARPENEQLAGLGIGKNYTVHAEHCAFADRTNRIDVAVMLPKAVLLIEAKIGAVQGKDQIERYRQVAADKARSLGTHGTASGTTVEAPKGHVLYLTTKAELNEGVVSVTWRDVAKAVRQAVAAAGAAKTLSGEIMMQFARHCHSLK